MKAVLLGINCIVIAFVIVLCFSTFWTYFTERVVKGTVTRVELAGEKSDRASANLVYLTFVSDGVEKEASLNGVSFGELPAVGATFPLEVSVQPRLHSPTYKWKNAGMGLMALGGIQFLIGVILKFS